MTEEQVKALFLLAGFEVTKKPIRLENKYWPDVPDYAEIRRQYPWWLVKTKYGLIEIGWRKRVISINWEDTSLRLKITTDEVTSEESYIHAYSYTKALEYLTELLRYLKGLES